MSMHVRVSIVAVALSALAGACSRSDDKEVPAARSTSSTPAAATGSGTEAVDRILGQIAKAPARRPAGFMGGLFGGKLAPALAGPTRAAATTAPGADPGAGADPGGVGADPGGVGAAPAGPPAATPLPPPSAAGGDCGAVAARVLAVAQAQVRAELAGDDEGTRAGAEEMAIGMLAQLETQVRAACEAQRWPAELRDCLLTAADLAALEGCERFATDDMRRAAAEAATDPGSAAPPPGPAPSWDGQRSDCDAVGEHAAALARWQVSGAPEEQRRAVEPMLGELSGQVAAACRAGDWSETGRRCMLQAGSVEALQACGAALAGP